MTKLIENLINLKLKTKKSYKQFKYNDKDTTDNFLNTIAKEISEGADIVELLNSNTHDNSFLEIAIKTKQLTEMFGATLLIRNRADIAYLSSADGVNLEREAIDLKSARTLLGENFLIGLYLKESDKDFFDSVKDGADYAIIEATNSTPTEPVVSTGLEYAKWVSENHYILVLR